MSKRVLVIGGAGFIGANLCRALLQQGHTVSCADNFSSGSRSNVETLLGTGRFELIEHDVVTPLSIETAAIYNLACPASPVFYQRDPVQTMRTCVLGAINILDLARHIGVPVLQASTSEVYGDPSAHPQHEGYWGNVNPIGIRACYDEGKRAAETLFFDYHRQFGVDIRVARIFNTYGPHMSVSDGRVVSNFIVQALRNEDITIYGDGMQTRSFCYVDDLVGGIMALMESGLVGPVNLGNPSELTMLALAQTVIELTGSRARIVHMPPPEDDPRQRRPDISVAAACLGWRPSVPLRDGLARTIAYFEGVLSDAAVSA